MRTSLPLVVLAAVGFGSVASAQCPEQRLSSAVPDFVHFGAWFRDPAAGGAGANLSNGVTVPFCP